MRQPYTLLLLLGLLAHQLGLAHQQPYGLLRATRASFTDSLDSCYDRYQEMAAHAPHFELELEYMSKVVYRGRDFGVQQHGFDPQLTFKTGRGVYFNLNNYYWSGLPNKLAKTDLGLGYERDINEHVFVSAGYERWFYYNGTHQERTLLNNFIETDISYEAGHLKLDHATYLIFNKDWLFLNALTLAGKFDILRYGPGCKVAIMPLVQATAGTHENYAYDVIGTVIDHGHSVRGTVEQDNTDNTYHVADYELGLPLEFTFQNLVVTPCFRYAFPIATKADEVSSLPSFGYWTVNMHYNFVKRTPTLLYR